MGHKQGHALGSEESTGWECAVLVSSWAFVLTVCLQGDIKTQTVCLLRGTGYTVMFRFRFEELQAISFSVSGTTSWDRRQQKAKTAENREEPVNRT